MISVIVPIYNVEDYLERCLLSLKGQTYQDLEIILVNDGSTDGSGNICERFCADDSRFRVITQPNSGVSKARNTGLKAASGDYISFVDADDYLEPDMYDALIRQASMSRSEVLVCGAMFHEPEKEPTNRIRGLQSQPVSASEALSNYLAHNYYGRGLWNKLFSRSILDEISFDEDIAYFEDSLFFCRVLRNLQNQKNDTVSFVPKTLYHYITGRSGSSIKDFDRYKTSLTAAERICNLFSNNKDNEEDQKLYDLAVFRYSFMAVNCCRQALLNHRDQEAKQYRLLATQAFQKTVFNKDIRLFDKLQVFLGLLSPVAGVNLWLKIRR